jgi:CRP/FNR family transcriptional regulator
MVVQLEFLNTIPYFSGLDSDGLEYIRKVAVEKNFDRGEMILLEGETALALYFVVSGAVKTFKASAEGKEQILSIVRPGEPFNDIPAFDGSPSPVSAQAMGAVTLCEIGKSDLEVVLQKFPKVSLNVITVLAGQMRRLVSLVEDLSFRRVTGRVAKILLENVGGGNGPGLRLTQQEMAAMAGTAREVVGRSLKALEEEGAITMDHHRIVIKDKEALKDMVGVPF